MSSLSHFINKQNINLLWDVLLDELNINKTNTKLIKNIRTVFESSINPFISSSNKSNANLNIMELNKLFLSQLVLAVNKLFPNFTSLQEQNFKRITIFDEDISESHSLEEPYKIEDIHASRQNNFEKEVEQKRMEMENYMTPQKPKELDFSDNISDSKIKSMDTLIANKMVQRNLEMEDFQQNNHNISPEIWLTSKETSVKNEKNITVQTDVIKHNQNSKLKHISFDNNNITLSNNETQFKNKKVSWDDLKEPPELTTSIFNKLKKHSIEENVIEINNKQYIEQKSEPLPQVKREEIQRHQTNLPTTPSIGIEPVIPKTEIIKQLNEMNNKIDNLYEMIYKLTSLIEKNNTEQIELQHIII